MICLFSKVRFHMRGFLQVLDTLLQSVKLSSNTHTHTHLQPPRPRQPRQPCPVSLTGGPSSSSMCECPSTQNLISFCTWWPRNGSWSFPSFSSRYTGACRTSNCSQNSSKSSGRGSSKQPWPPERGSSREGLTQVTGSGTGKGKLRPRGCCH